MARKRPGYGLTALITGASGGIGEALAKCLAADGHDLILVARSEPKLDLLAGDLSSGHDVDVRIVPMDLAQPNAGTRLQDEVSRLDRHVDILVNNAGYALLGRLVELNHADQLRMIDLNVRCLTDLTRTFVPAMIGHGRGGVMNIASVAAFQPGPLMAVYYATKAYVLSFTEALNFELRGTDVHATAVCPGPVHSGFQERSGLERARRGRLLPAMTCRQVAAAAYSGFRARRPVVIPGLANRLLARSSTLTPHFLSLPLIRQMHGGD